MATSGNYRNFYIEKGVKYSHTIDPRNGFPARNELLSATILAPDCMTADAWATACMVLGKDKCLDLIAKDSTLDAFLLFNKDGKISSAYTPGAEKLLKK
jgi:thiamine biosynthesis lipoprotein